MTTLTRTNIVESLAQEIDLSRYQATAFLEATLETMIIALTEEGLVKISSFGSFNVRQKAKRIGRNPKTKKEAVITPRRVLSFKASHHLKEKIQKRMA